MWTKQQLEECICKSNMHEWCLQYQRGKSWDLGFLAGLKAAKRAVDEDEQIDEMIEEFVKSRNEKV